MAFDPLENPEQHDEAILSLLAERGPLSQEHIVLALMEQNPSWPAARGRPAGGTRSAGLIAWMLSARRRGLVRVDEDGFFHLEDAGRERAGGA